MEHPANAPSLLLQVREGAGRFVDVRTIGPHCREDDELVLQWQADAEARFQRDKARSRRRAGLAAPTAAKDNESDSPSDRVDADSARRAESADLEGDSETQALPARPRGGARSQGLEMRGGDDREPESEVVSVGGPGTSSFATFGVRLSKGDRPEGRPVRAYEWRESGVRGAVGAAGRAGGMLSILEERRRSHLAAGPSAPPTGGAFAAHFKRLPEGAREGARMSDEEMAARNAAAGHGELHARLEGLRQRLQAEQGGSAEVWRGDGLHDEDAAEGGAGPGEEAPQGEVSSRPQVGWKRDAENAGISHEWGGLHGYYAQAGKRGRLGWDGGVAGRLGKRDMSDMDECTSDFGQEGPAEVPGQEGAPAHRFPYGGGLLGGQAECAGGGEDVAGVKKDQAEPGAYPVWEQSDAAPMRLHGGAPTASHTVSYTESEEEEGEQTDTRETGTATAGLQADWRQDLRSTRGTGTSVVEHTPGVLQGPERGAGAALELPGWQGLRPPSAGWATGLQLPRAADEWETAHRQLPESGVGEEGLRGLAGGGTWMAPPDEEDDPMGRFSAVRPKSRHERMSAWEQAHWQLPDSDSGEERTQRRGRAGPGRIARGREAARAGGSSAPQLASDSGRDAGGSRWPPVTLYQPFGNGTQHRQAGGDGRGGIGLAQPRGGGQGSGGGGALAGLPNRTGAMVEAAGSDGARIRLAEGLGRGQARGQGQEEEDGVGLEGGVVYNIEDEDEGGGPTRVNSRLMSRSEGLGLRAGAPGMAGTAAAGSSPPLTHRSRGAGPARWEHTPPGEALQGAGAFRAGSAAVPRWPGQGLRTVHGGVYTSDLIEQLGRAFREAPRAADPPPGRRPLGPEWGAPLAPAEGPLWGTAPHPFFRREGGGLWNTPARSGFAHLHQAVGATRAPSTSSGGDDGEGRPGGRAASGGLLAAGRMAGEDAGLRRCRVNIGIRRCEESSYSKFGVFKH